VDVPFTSSECVLMRAVLSNRKSRDHLVIGLRCLNECGAKATGDEEGDWIGLEGVRDENMDESWIAG
jgi:hypothetical protein